MHANKFDALETSVIVEQLLKRLGGSSECNRLGFIHEDGEGVIRPSHAGLSYLILVAAREIDDPAEAFAAGYRAALEQQ